MRWPFRRKKEEQFEITPALVYVTGMRLLFDAPFGIGIDKVRSGKAIKKAYNARRSRGVYYIAGSPRSIRIDHPAPRDVVLTVFYGLEFTRSYTSSMVAYVEFNKELIKPLGKKVRIKKDVFVPGKRMYNILANTHGTSALVHDRVLVDSLPRNKRGMPVPPSVDMLYVRYDPNIAKGYVFYVANLKRVRSLV